MVKQRAQTPEGFIRIRYETDLQNNRKDCFQCIGCSTNHKPVVLKGESWKKHRQSKVHSLRVCAAESPNRSHETGVGGVAPLVFTEIPQPQLSAAIPVDHERLWADCVGTDGGFNLGEPYHAADGSVIQFSAGLMYPSAEEGIRCEMNRLGEELEAWGSSLAGEGFEGGIDGMEDNHEEHNNSSMTQEIARSLLSTNTSHDLFPYVSRTMLALDLIDHLPRCQISQDTLKAILACMVISGTPDVPSFSGLQSTQEVLDKVLGLIPQKHVSSLGNVFYMNPPSALISLDFANPKVRPLLHLYPEVQCAISEPWHAAKWVKETPPDQLEPMWADWEANPWRHYFINELAQTLDGSYVMLQRWVVVNKQMEVEVYLVNQNTDGYFVVCDNTIKQMHAKDLRRSILDILRSIPSIHFQNWKFPLTHPLRDQADGRPVFNIRLSVWTDDVSGNTSKQYNPHMNMYLSNQNIPHRYLVQEYFVRFVTTSPHASSSELFQGLQKYMVPGRLHKAYDCVLNTEILFHLLLHNLPGDNPQQSEDASHISGGNCNMISRADTTGGTRGEKETDDGYDQLFLPGLPRCPEWTVAVIHEQLRRAAFGDKKNVEKLRSETGVKDKIAQHWIGILIEKAKVMMTIRCTDPKTKDIRLKGKMSAEERTKVKDVIRREIQKELIDWLVCQPEDNYGQIQSEFDQHNFRPGDHYNILLEMKGIDPHSDTPFEMLHTLLLGGEKYPWHRFSKKWSHTEEITFAARLQSASLSGLSIDAFDARYIVSYKNSLIGRHFRILQQLAIFQLEGLCTAVEFDMWKALGELGALLWYHEIKDMDSYLQDIQIGIDNILDIWTILDPSRIIEKSKLHVFTHLPGHIRRFGPPVLYSTEVFEAWNSVFRACSILSNHHAPSHDITTELAGMERVKHLVSGGWWEDNGKYLQAGEGVQEVFDSKDFQRRLGWVTGQLSVPGTTHIEKATQPPGTWQEVTVGINILLPRDINAEDKWAHCSYVIAESGDKCKPDSWVFFRSPCDSPPMVDEVSVGRIALILQQKTTNNSTAHQSLVILAPFHIVQDLDPHFNMPILNRTSHHYVVVKAENIRFIFNAQHHCKSGNCKIRTRTQIQEREQTTRTIPHMEHADDNKFLVNMHAIHNASLIRETVKTVYGGPKPYFGTDRRSHHNAAAARLRVSGPKKRAEANEKRKATRERNKSAKRAQAAEEANAFSKMQHSGDGGSDGEVASGCDSSGNEGHEEHDSERETDAMEVD